jgi:hypothetical protein
MIHQERWRRFLLEEALGAERRIPGRSVGEPMSSMPAASNAAITSSSAEDRLGARSSTASNRLIVLLVTPDFLRDTRLGSKPRLRWLAATKGLSPGRAMRSRSSLFLPPTRFGPLHELLACHPAPRDQANLRRACSLGLFGAAGLTRCSPFQLIGGTAAGLSFPQNTTGDCC